MATGWEWMGGGGQSVRQWLGKYTCIYIFIYVILSQCLHENIRGSATQRSPTARHSRLWHRNCQEENITDTKRAGRREDDKIARQRHENKKEQRHLVRKCALVFFEWQLGAIFNSEDYSNFKMLFVAGRGSFSPYS